MGEQNLADIFFGAHFVGEKTFFLVKKSGLVWSGLVWDKQWKSRMRCLDKFALGRSRGKSDFPEGCSPEGKSDYPRDLPWANLPDNA